MCDPQHYDFDINLDFLDFTSVPTQGAQSAVPVAISEPKACLDKKTPAHVERKNFKIEELAKRIANADLSVHQIQTLEKERSILQHQLTELQSSANDIRKLYLQENQERKRLKQLTDELSTKCESLQSEITNKTFSCEQLESHIETFRCLPVEYNDLVQSYLRLCHQHQEEKKTLNWHQTFLIDKLRKYCKDHSLPLPEQNKRSPKKRTPKITKTEAGIQCEILLAAPIPIPQPPTVKKEMRSQGTQHISTTTTRSTSTTTLITKHNVGTCFPEPRSLPAINDIVNEMLMWDIQPLSPISDPIPTIPIDIVPTRKSTGTCTMLCNIQKTIDYVGSHSLLTSIKHSNSRPPSRNMIENVKHELPSPPATFAHLGSINSGLSAGTFEDMWQVFGHVLFSLLGNRTDARNATERPGDALSHQEFHHWFRSMYQELAAKQEHECNLSTGTSVPVNMHAPSSEADARPAQYNVASSPLRFENTRSICETTSAANDILDNRLQIDSAAGSMQFTSLPPTEIFKIHAQSQAQTETPNSNFQVPLDGSEFRKSNKDNIVTEILNLFPTTECTKEKERKIKKLLREKFKGLNKRRKIKAKQEVQMQDIHAKNVDVPNVLQSKYPQNSVAEEEIMESLGQISEQQCDFEEHVEEVQIKNESAIKVIENHTQLYAVHENSEETIIKYDKEESEILEMNSLAKEELETYKKEEHFTTLAQNCKENAVDFLAQLRISNNIADTEISTSKSFKATFLNVVPNETDCHVFRKPIAYAVQKKNNGQSAETSSLVFSSIGSDSDDSDLNEVDPNFNEMKQDESRSETFEGVDYNCYQNETEIQQTKDESSLLVEGLKSIEEHSYSEKHKCMDEPYRRKLFPADSFVPELNDQPSLNKRYRPDMPQSRMNHYHNETLDTASEVQLLKKPFEGSQKTYFMDGNNADLKKRQSQRDPSECFPYQFGQKSEIKSVPSQSNLFQQDMRRNDLPEFKIFQKPLNVNELRLFRMRQKPNNENRPHKSPKFQRPMGDDSDTLVPLKANETNQQLMNENMPPKSLDNVTAENGAQQRLQYSSDYQSEEHYFISPKKLDVITPMEIKLPCIIEECDVVEYPDRSLIIDENHGNSSDAITDDSNIIEISSTIKEESAVQTDISSKTENKIKLKADELKLREEIKLLESEMNMSDSNYSSISKSSDELNTTENNRPSISCSLINRDESTTIENDIKSISKNEDDSEMAENKCSISPIIDSNLLSDILTTSTVEVISDFLEDDKHIDSEDDEYKFKNYLNQILRDVAPRNVTPISSIATISTISMNKPELCPANHAETNSNPSEPKRRGRKRKINTCQNLPPTSAIACKRSERLRVKKLVVEATSESIVSPPTHALVQLGKYTTKRVNKINKFKEKKIPTSPEKFNESDDEPLSISVNNVGNFNERSSDLICKHLISDKEANTLEKQTNVVLNKSPSTPKTSLSTKRTSFEFGPRSVEVPKAFQNNFQNSAEWNCKTLEKKKCVVFPQQIVLKAKNIVTRTETSEKSNTNCDIHRDTTLSNISLTQYDSIASPQPSTESPSAGFYDVSEEIPPEPDTRHLSANRLKTFSLLPTEENNASPTSPSPPKENKYKTCVHLSGEQNGSPSTPSLSTENEDITYLLLPAKHLDSPASPPLSTENEDKTYLLQPAKHLDSPASPPQSIKSRNVNKNTKEIPLELDTTPILTFKTSLIQRLISNYSCKLYQRCILRKAFQPTTETETLLSQSLQKFLDMQTDDESASMLLVEEIFSIAQHDVSSQISAAIVLVMQNVPRPEVELDCTIDKVPEKYLGKQHRRMSLVMRRIQTVHSHFISELMTQIERKLFNYHSTEKINLHAALNLTQLYLLTVSMQLPVMKICPTRLFVIKCLYYYKLMAVPMIYEVLSCFPTTLPHREERRYDRADALITVIQHHLMSTKYDMDKQELRTKDLLSKLRFEYHFEPFKPDRPEVIANLLSKLKADKLEHVSYALALLCKRTAQPKVEEEILKGLLVPLANEYYQNVAHSEIHDTRIACLVESISMIIKPFAIETDISSYMSIFSRFLNATTRPTLQESAVQAILRCQRFGFVNCYNELLNFNPSYELQAKTKAMLQSFVHQKPKKFWISYNKKK